MSFNEAGASKSNVKPIFASPNQAESNSSSIEALIAKHSFPEDLDRYLSQVRKEDHEKRIKYLRKQLDYIEDTNWKPRPTLVIAQCYYIGVSKRFISSSATLHYSTKSFMSLKKDISERVKKERKLATTFKAKMMEKIKLQPSPNVFFQIIGNGNLSGDRSLFLCTDRCRLLFNCTEGTQRATYEEPKNSRSIARLKQILLTSPKWRNIGGLLGLCLTVRALQNPRVPILGLEHDRNLFQDVRRLTNHFDYNKVISIEENNSSYEDETCLIELVKLDYNGPPVIPGIPSHSQWSCNKKSGLPCSDTNILNQQSAQNMKPINQSVFAYVINIKKPPGRLCIQKCLELGVPTGPLLGELKSGKDVTLENGQIVKSSEVVEKSGADQKCVVIEVPSNRYLDSLKSCAELNEELFSSVEIPVIFHFTPLDVVKEQEYVQWMEKFGPKTKHMFLNERESNFCNLSVLTLIKKMRMVAPPLFPEMWTHSFDKSYHDLVNQLGDRVIETRNHRKIHIRPKIEVKDVIDEQFNESEVEESVYELNGFKDAFEQLQKQISVDETKCEYPKITFLGTGSSVPNKYRNVSSILCEVSKDRFFMMDCGEGTIIQLFRSFGPDKAKEILKNLRGIYVSHLHTDHHLGLINILVERLQAFRSSGEEVEKIFILAPSPLAGFLINYHRNHEPILEDAVQIKSEFLMLNKVQGSKQPNQILHPHIAEEMKSFVGITDVATCYANHAPYSFCLSFKTVQDNISLAYSGDTLPNPYFVKLCSGVRSPDILIHEATFQDSMKDECIVKKHSSFVDAINIGKSMDAKFTLLTHFSQRYSKVPLLDEIEGHKNVGIAFDHMTVTPQTIHNTNLLFPILKILFEKELEDVRVDSDQKIGKYFNSDTVLGSLGLDLDALEAESPSEPKKQRLEVKKTR